MPLRLQEAVDIIAIYFECLENATIAARLYALRYPQRRRYGSRMFSRLANRFRTTGSVIRPLYLRQRTRRTEENVINVLAYVEFNPQLSVLLEKPADLQNTLNPDWVPTLNMGYSRGDTVSAATKLARFNRRRLSLSVPNEPSTSNSEVCIVCDVRKSPEFHDAASYNKSVQTTLTMQDVTNLHLQLNKLKEDVEISAKKMNQFCIKELAMYNSTLYTKVVKSVIVALAPVYFARGAAPSEIRNSVKLAKISDSIPNTSALPVAEYFIEQPPAININLPSTSGVQEIGQKVTTSHDARAADSDSDVVQELLEEDSVSTTDSEGLKGSPKKRRKLMRLGHKYR
ncbi:hypothetical protein FQR65_LT14052 [Abscondita terminalis]|nr:hypothetical protein FQR65_LT14052 [Abscondita terminalis]